MGCLRRIAFGAVPDATPTLAERLGHPADARLVIISCDDLGAVPRRQHRRVHAMREGAATCASLMVPAPWARQAAAMYEEGEDIGVHLTLNCEHELYRWGPITHAPSLLTGDGGFPRTIDDLWEHADPDEVRRECRAQIERALAWGFDVSHLAPHLTAITLRPEFFDVYLEHGRRVPAADPPAVDDHGRAGRLPVPPPGRRGGRRVPRPLRPRLAGRQPRAACSTPSRRCSRASPRSTSSRRSTRPRCGRCRRRPRAGSTTSRWSVDDPAIPALLAEVGAVLIGYSELRDAQRAS